MQSYNIILEDGGFATVENGVELGILPRDAEYPYVYSLRIGGLNCYREPIPEKTFWAAKKWLGKKIYDVCREQAQELRKKLYALDAIFDIAEGLLAVDW